MGSKDLPNQMNSLFTPESIVLIGASGNPRSLGFTIARVLIRYFSGPVHYVSATEAKVLGFNTYASITDVPEGKHLWIISTPMKKFPETLRRIKKRQPSGVLILVELPKSLLSGITEVISQFSCPVIGPRSAGYYDSATISDTIILPSEMLSRPPEGAVGAITDNRDVAFGIMEQLSKYRCGVSKFIDLGDSLGTNETDTLSFLTNDPKTHVILFGCGQINQINKFQTAVNYAHQKQKPIIVPLLEQKIIKKLGLHRRTSTSITELTKELTANHQIIPTSSWGRAVDLAKLLQWQPLPRGSGVTVISNFGPYCVNAANAFQNSKLKLITFKAKISQNLKKTLPPYCRAANPVCLYTNADEIRLDATLRIILDDSSTHIIMLSLLPNSPYIDPDYLSVMLRQHLARTETPKTIIGIIPAVEPDNLLIRCLEQLKIPVYSNPHRAISTLETAYRYASTQKLDKRNE
jgi:acyl-CoA synthetase (NDP forming)